MSLQDEMAASHAADYSQQRKNTELQIAISRYLRDRGDSIPLPLGEALELAHTKLGDDNAHIVQVWN